MSRLFGLVCTNPETCHAILPRLNGASQTGDANTILGHGWLLVAFGPRAQSAMVTFDPFRVAACGTVHGPGPRARQESGRDQGAAVSTPEAVKAAYQVSGSDGVMSLNGSFTACVLDTREPSAARVELLVDPIGGIHHLHYATFPGGIVFASDIRRILATGLVEADPDEDSVVEFFSHGHSLPPKTFFKGIRKVAPGTVVSYHRGELKVQRAGQWDFATDPCEDCDHLERFQVALTRAVQVRSEAADRVGAFLSGGLDSSVNVALLARERGPGVDTFSIAYPQARYDESEYARAVAKHCETSHHELVLSSPRLLEDLPTMLWHLEEPTGDNSFVPTFALSRFARSVTDTVLSGDGPDHLFGRHYPMAVARETLGRLPGGACLARLSDAAPGAWERIRESRSGRHAWKTLRATRPRVLDAYLSIYEDIVWGSLSPRRLSRLLHPRLTAHRNGECERAELNSAVQGLAPGDQMIALDIACDGAFGVFAKIGKMTAASGLTVLEPYFDREVVHATHGLPDHLRVHGTAMDRLRNRAVRKYALRMMARDLVPEMVLTKPKHGFEAPVGDWLREWLAGLPAERVFPRLIAREWIWPAFAQRLLNDHNTRVRDHGYLLFMLVTTELWYRIFVDESGQQPGYTWSDYIG